MRKWQVTYRTARGWHRVFAWCEAEAKQFATEAREAGFQTEVTEVAEAATTAKAVAACGYGYAEA